MAKYMAVVGADRVGRSLVGMLPDDWVITVVDIDPEKLEGIPDHKGDNPVRTVAGDATSRLVLESLALTPSTTVTITTGDDAVNLEIARLLQDFNIAHIVCLLHDKSAAEGATLQNTEVIERTAALSSLLFNRLCWTESRGVGVGLGEGELLETRILDGSAAAGRKLKHLNPHQWLVAAVYRNDTLIVPHGDTVLQVDDRVLLVGEPHVLKSVGAFVRGGEPVFPIQFGDRVGVDGSDVARVEAEWLCEKTRADAVDLLEGLNLRPRTVADGGALSDSLSAAGVGVLVLEPQPISLAARIGLVRSPRKRLVDFADVPVLIARGTTPFCRVLLAVSGLSQIRNLAHVAIDMTRLCGAELTVLTVLPPALSEGEEQLEQLKSIPQRVAHIGRLYGVDITVEHAEGNPIDCIRKKAADFDLLVLGSSPKLSRSSILSPNVSLFLLHDAPCSTMFVPWDSLQ